jgi:3-phenylpropionate/trans-cinnamate dioxygenase ferredoxin reductase subunit
MEVAQEAGLECANGIVVNSHCETSVPGVFAVGDVADHFNQLFGRTLRVEHYENAIRQGALVADNILGRATPNLEPYWFWSDQYEHTLQGTGLIGAGDQVVMRGQLASRHFTAFYLERGRILGAVGLNSTQDVRRAMRLIASKSQVDARDLQDPDKDLRKVARR